MTSVWTSVWTGERILGLLKLPGPPVVDILVGVFKIDAARDRIFLD